MSETITKTTTTDPEEITPPVRGVSVCSFNIQAGIATGRSMDYLLGARDHFFHTPRKTRKLEAIAEYIGQFDIVCLQEIDTGGRRSGFNCQADHLAELAGFEHTAKQQNRKIRNISLHGNAIFSRWPILDFKDVKLPGRVSGRGALIAEIDHVNKLTIMNAHLSLGRADQMMQIAHLKSLVEPERAVIAGDFNCGRGIAAIQSLIEDGWQATSAKRIATYPSWKPVKDYDHILTSSDLDTLQAKRGEVGLSDHLPVEARIIIKPNQDERDG